MLFRSKLIKGGSVAKVEVSSSEDNHFTNFKQFEFEPNDILSCNDPERFIRIPTSDLHLEFGESKLFEHTLGDLGLQVSTGPVVDFRSRQYLLSVPTEHSIPMPYPHHFSDGKIEYPKAHKKYPNAMVYDESIKKQFWPAGYYVLIKRFSSKEERRRIVAFFIEPDSFKSDLIAFENGWNVLHIAKNGIEKMVASGLTCFLNSTEVDNYFRVFSGHTQVNATDLRNMKFPSFATLAEIGQIYKSSMNQSEIDVVVESYK